jgi:hypothetical protein
MKALQNLVRIAKDTETELGEVRDYATMNSAELADAFGVSEAAFTCGIASEPDDAKLARRLFAEAKRAGRETRAARTAQRTRSAQEAADALGGTAQWEDAHAKVDVRSLLGSALTTRGDALVFESATFTVAIPMQRLFELARLRRSDLSGYVDAHGLHIRWASGGLNFISVKLDPKASTITVNLRARTTVAA